MSSETWGIIAEKNIINIYSGDYSRDRSLPTKGEMDRIFKVDIKKLLPYIISPQNDDSSPKQSELQIEDYYFHKENIRPTHLCLFNPELSNENNSKNISFPIKGNKLCKSKMRINCIIRNIDTSITHAYDELQKMIYLVITYRGTDKDTVPISLSTKIDKYAITDKIIQKRQQYPGNNICILTGVRSYSYINEIYGSDTFSVPMLEVSRMNEYSSLVFSDQEILWNIKLDLQIEIKRIPRAWAIAWDGAMTLYYHFQPYQENTNDDNKQQDSISHRSRYLAANLDL